MTCLMGRYLVVAAMLGAMLAGCGGGGGGDPTPPPPQPALDDPLYGDQWHLKNTGQAGNGGQPGTPGEDINVEPVWSGGTKGAGARIAVVDDGLEIAHEDLVANVVPGKSWDYVGNDTDPTPPPVPSNNCSDANAPDNCHGTAVAGLAAARDLNGLGGRGVAPRASIVGYNLLRNLNDPNEVDAMTRDAANNSISSNSWGAADEEGTLAVASDAWKGAIGTGLRTGRGGRGIVYAWAAGNGSPLDNSNYDGRANFRGVMAVGAVTDKGTKSSYSEPGANLWVSAPAGEFCSTHTLTTTDLMGDRGYNKAATANEYADRNYTKCMNGTSGATPIVSGAVALMLEANPNLGWRDVRLILASTARQNDAADPGWTLSATNPAYHFNHKYGFGVVDAQAAVTRAKTWTNVYQEKTYTTALAAPNLAIPDNDAAGIAHSINVANSGIDKIEFIEITFSATNHTYSGDLEVALISPVGTESLLADTRVCRDTDTGAQIDCGSYNQWIFGSARHLGEKADGNWTLVVADKAAAKTGTFQSWKLKFYGTGRWACSTTQTAGGDTPDTRQIELGRSSGTFDFRYQTYSIKDQMRIHYEGKVLFDTGCVGESKTVPIPYAGNSTIIAVEVLPNCAGPTTGTAWNYTVNCPR